MLKDIKPFGRYINCEKTKEAALLLRYNKRKHSKPNKPALEMKPKLESP